MRPILFFAFLMFVISGCNRETDMSSVDPVSWENRSIDLSGRDSLHYGESYLSVYSEIYSESEHKTHPLTATISMRNINRTDTVFLKKAEYFNTAGHAIHSYFDHPIYLAPMETVEIVIDQENAEGGSGANFIFDWATKNHSKPPFFECVMISTYGTQGLSFTTQGITL